MAIRTEKQMLEDYLKRQEEAKAKPRSRFTMDFGQGPEDVSQYMNLKHPGTQNLKMFSDPYCILKDGEAKREAWQKRIAAAVAKDGSRIPDVPEYVWREKVNSVTKERDTVTMTGVNQGWLTPVFKDDVDLTSAHALLNFESVPTPTGRRDQVQVDGLFLYRISLEKAYEWFGYDINKYKGELANMRYGQSKSLAKEGYEPIRQWEGTNMNISDTKREYVLGD